MIEPVAGRDAPLVHAEVDPAVPANREPWSVDHLRSLIDRRLRILVPGVQIPPQRLHQAMSYSLLARASGRASRC
jgi:hypothetical protein